MKHPQDKEETNVKPTISAAGLIRIGPAMSHAGRAAASLLVLVLTLFSCSLLAAPISTQVQIGSCFSIESKVLHEQRKYCVHLPASYFSAQAHNAITPCFTCWMVRTFSSELPMSPSL
jgi:hypothetical protein